MNSKWREEFIARVSRDREPLPLHTIRSLFRVAATLRRLAEAQCNGDWPYNGDRDRPLSSDLAATVRWEGRYLVCPLCEASGVARSVVLKGGCPDCRTAARTQTLLEGTPWRPVFGGDPRGCVLTIARRTATEEEIQNGRAQSAGDAIGVPA